MKKIKAWAVTNNQTFNNGYIEPMFFMTVYFEEQRAKSYLRDVEGNDLKIVEIEFSLKKLKNNSTT